jgi:uncharacterized CHY-type Zn-finger protein
MNSEVDKSGAGGDKDSHEGITLMGFPVDGQTRCKHYHSPLDIIAIKFRCCGQYYPCHSCHVETAGHTSVKWGRDEQDAKAVLCGGCGYEMSIREYLGCHHHCPRCRSAFNPGCSNHYHLYFE